MRAGLMFRDRDFSISAPTVFGRDTLCADFEIKRIIERMAGKDLNIEQAVNSALFNPLCDIEDILYRQRVLKDCMEHPAQVRELYELVSQSERFQGEMVKGMRTDPQMEDTLTDALTILRTQMEHLKLTRDMVLKNTAGFTSEGFTELAKMLKTQLPDKYFSEVAAGLREFKDREGMLVGVSLGSGLQGVNYTMLRKKSELFRRPSNSGTYTVNSQDQAARNDLRQRRERAANDCTAPLARAAEGIWRFFWLLCGELAFYVGCLNLYDALTQLGMPVCIPTPLPAESSHREWSGLYDISLALLKNEKVGSNRLEGHDKRLYIITGANQGGKSTFLRSFGQATLMTQCGMFASGDSFVAPVRLNIFSHFRKEEDSDMNHGKFDEELTRLDRITDRLTRDSLIIFNEAFAATNEREGSEICRQVIRALVEAGVEVFTVTHLYSYAASELDNPEAVFLRAERLESGERTFRIVPGEPFVTAFGEDLYKKIFKKQ
ncbi:MAG: hypothetical protein K5855_04345 [Oscillospiraceae bacterium]|nr:hypothetical protein [Oscillospiraceae bacterium]